MTTLMLLATCLLPLSTPADASDLVSAWQQRETQFQTVDVQWEVTRDSRTPNFGIEKPRSSEHATWRLRLDKDRWRIDGHRLTTLSRDGIQRAAEENADRARLEFRHVLLEERLQGPQPFPERVPYAYVESKSAVTPKEGFSHLEQHLARAPLIAARPLLLLKGESLTKTDRTAHVRGTRLPIYQAQNTDHKNCELWVDPDHHHRLVRLIEHQDGGNAVQFDFEYDDDKAILPNRWTVLTLDSGGLVVAFAEGTKSRLVPNPSIPDSVFRVQNDDRLEQEPSWPEWTRNLSRSILDSFWLTTGIVIGVVLIIRWGWARTSTKRTEAPPPEDNEKPTS